jgi:hypothetical protein
MGTWRTEDRTPVFEKSHHALGLLFMQLSIPAGAPCKDTLVDLVHFAP